MLLSNKPLELGQSEFGFTKLLVCNEKDASISVHCLFSFLKTSVYNKILELNKEIHEKFIESCFIAILLVLFVEEALNCQVIVWNCHRALSPSLVKIVDSTCVQYLAMGKKTKSSNLGRSLIRDRFNHGSRRTVDNNSMVSELTIPLKALRLT